MLYYFTNITLFPRVYSVYKRFKLYFFKQEFSEKENLTPPTTPYYSRRALTHILKDCSNELSNAFQTLPRQTNRLDPKQHFKKALSLALTHS